MRKNLPIYVIVFVFGCLLIISFLVNALLSLPRHEEDLSKKVIYSVDSSITFIGIGDRVTFTVSELPELYSMLTKADQLDKECKKVLKVDTNIPLGTIGDHKFDYYWDSWGYSILIVRTKYDYVGIHQRDKYISYLTTYRDKANKQAMELKRIKDKLNIK
jgi:hypothetical protein